jgi:hypothetical protein
MNPLDIIAIGGKLLDKIIPDKDARDKAQAVLLQTAQDQDFQLSLGQIEVNKIETQSESIFKSGWRPFVGWTCASAFALHFVIFPIIDKIIVSFGGLAVAIPFQIEALMTVLFGLLGLGGFRTFEKIKGVK